MHSPTVSHVISLLTILYEKNPKCQTISIFRSCLSSTLFPVNSVFVGQHPLVYQLMKGIFYSRPPIKKLVPSWSIAKYFQTLRQWSPPGQLDIKCLSYKVITLLYFTSAKRCSSLALLSLKLGYYEISKSRARFHPIHWQKQPRRRHIGLPVDINFFTEDPIIDLVRYVKEYVRKTKNIRKSDMYL